MTKIKSDLKCPKCKKKNRIKLYDEVTEITKVIDRSLFTFTCSSCQENITIDYPFILKRENYIIYYTPTSNSSIKDTSGKKIKRVCDTYIDLKEKILILEDGLDDIVIEFIKLFLVELMNEEDKKNITDIRYNSKEDNQLIFYLFGINQSIGSSINFYENIKKKSKCKTIKDACVVDSKTFNDYFKMR